MRRNVISSILFISIFGLFVGVSLAYFIYAGQTEAVATNTGSIELVITSTTPSELENWLPGEEKDLEYVIQNSGSSSLFIKAYLNGEWEDQSLSTSVAQIVYLDIWDGNSWVPLRIQPPQLGEEFEFYYDYTQAELREIIPNQEVRLRVGLKLDESTDNAYQNQAFQTSLHVAGRQTTEGANWPDGY